MSGKYRTIVADPPWEVQRGPVWGTGGASRPLEYGTMHVDEIAALPVADLATPDAHLYVWTINAYVEQTYEIVRGWGFRASQLLTWCKAPKGIGLGGAYTGTTEFVLYARRGKLAPLSRADTSWWQWKRPHEGGVMVSSRKPDAFIDVVEQVSPGPYLELFARRARFGWDYWGDESFGTAHMPGEAA